MDINSLKFSENLKLLREVLLHADVKTTFLGGRIVTLKEAGVTGSMSLDSLALEVRGVGLERRAADNLTLEERVAGLAILKILEGFYRQTDEAFKGSYKITQNIRWIREGFGADPNRVLLEAGEMKDHFLAFSPERFLKQFGGSLRDNHPYHPDANMIVLPADGRITAKESSIERLMADQGLNKQVQISPSPESDLTFNLHFSRTIELPVELPLEEESRDNELPLVNENYRSIFYPALAATGLSIAAVALAPWETARIIGAMVLTGVSYGIVNDMVACRDCIEYFTVDHFYDGKSLKSRLVNTLNPTLNALAWGMFATWHVSAIAGAFFAFLARTPLPGLALKITAVQLAPYLAIGAAVAFLVAHIRSRSAQKAMEENPWMKYWTAPMEFQPGWEACNTRNMTGYAAVGIGGALLSTVIVAARAGLFVL